MSQCCNSQSCDQCLIPCDGPNYINVPSLCWKNFELSYSDKYNTSNASKYDMVNRLQNNQFGINYPPSMYPSNYFPQPPVQPYPGGKLLPERNGDVRNWPQGGKGDLPDTPRFKADPKDPLYDRIAGFGAGFPVNPGLAQNSQFFTVDDGRCLGPGDGSRRGKGSFRNIGRRLLPAPPPCPFRLLSFSQSWNLKNCGKICVYRKDNFPCDDSSSVFTPHIESWGLYTKLVGEFRFGVTIQLFNPSVSQSMASLFGYGTAGLPNFPTPYPDRRPGGRGTTEGCLPESRECDGGIEADPYYDFRQDLGGYNFSNDITASSQKTFEWTVPVSIEYTPLDRNFKATITRVIGSDTMQWTTDELPFINFKHLTTPQFIMEYLGEDFLGQNLSFNDIFTQKMIQSGSYPSITSAIYGGNFNSLKNLLFGFFSKLIETLFLHNGKIAASFSYTKNSNSSPCTWTGSVMGQGQSLYIPAPRRRPCNFRQLGDFDDGDEEDIEEDDDFNEEGDLRGNSDRLKRIDCRRRDPYTRRSLLQYFIPTTGTPVVVNNFPYGTALVCGQFGKCYAGCDPKGKNRCFR